MNVESPTRSCYEKQDRTQNQTRPESWWIGLGSTPCDGGSLRASGAHLFCRNSRGWHKPHATGWLHEGLPHFFTGLKSIPGIFGEGFPNDAIDPTGNRRINE